MSAPIDAGGPHHAPLVIASSNAPALVQSGGVAVPLAVEPGTTGILAAAHASNPSSLRIYLILEHIRGMLDATVLRAFLHTASTGNGSQPHGTWLGSVGLYGLRRASSGVAGTGMLHYVDVTPHAALILGMAANAPQLVVSLLPQPTLPDSVSIEVGRVGICAERLTH
ncbi:hypothetical protein GCM10027093_68610 [Paraburkholderia jirisanensis]